MFVSNDSLYRTFLAKKEKKKRTLFKIESRTLKFLIRFFLRMCNGILDSIRIRTLSMSKSNIDAYLSKLYGEP